MLLSGAEDKEGTLRHALSCGAAVAGGRAVTADVCLPSLWSKMSSLRKLMQVYYYDNSCTSLWFYVIVSPSQMRST